VFINQVELKQVYVFQILDMLHSFNIILLLISFNHRKVHLSTTCKIFKTSFQMEKYFELLEHKKAIDFCRFTTTNHKLSIEQSRWDNIDSNNRISSWRFLCNSDIGDEFHYDRKGFLNDRIIRSNRYRKSII
jgi:hypothetical protein